MKFSIKCFFSKCDQIRSFLRIWSHLLKNFLMENVIFVQWHRDFSTLIMFSFTVYLVFSLVFKYLLLSHFRIRRYANEQPLFPTLLLTISLNMIYQFPNSCFIKKYFFHYFKKFSIFPFCHFYADI